MVKARLKTLGAPVRSLVSDRAQALIKLAKTGLGCLSIPDVFHLIHALVKSYALAIGSRLRQARQALSQAQEHLAKLRRAIQVGLRLHWRGWRSWRVKPK